MASTVRIVEVGPRDGLQNETRAISAEQRIAFITALADSGLREIEVGSFVSPRWVPQMANTEKVLAGVPRRSGLRHAVLVPNAQGMDLALAAGAEQVTLFLSASESFSHRNINASIDASFERVAPVAEKARAIGVPMRGYVSCALGCPYEGEVALSSVVSVAERLVELGCYEISLGDTIGVGTATKARRMLETVASAIPMEQLAVHFHDTYGQALANVLACLEAGVRVVDASAGGLGGCPYASGASGNLATEDLLYMLDGLGMQTGVDLERLLRVVDYIAGPMGIPPRSKVYAARAGATPRAKPSGEAATRG